MLAYCNSFEHRRNRSNITEAPPRSREQRSKTLHVASQSWSHGVANSRYSESANDVDVRKQPAKSSASTPQPAKAHSSQSSKEWPPSLEEWKLILKDPVPETLYNLLLWREMAPAFSRQGVELYLPDLETPYTFMRRPPNPDQLVMPPNAFETEVGTWDSKNHRAMQQKSPAVYPAINLDGSDVFVRVVSKGSVPSRQLEILRYLSAEPQRSDPRNHTIPVIQELVYEDWTFVTMPRFSPSPLPHAYWRERWFATLGEIIEFFRQMIEGFAFLHEHRIAHQDISTDNLVVNHLGDMTLGFLSRFPCRYYIIDLELAIQLPPDTHISNRVLTGPPIANLNPIRLPPEVGESPHSPFAADVWQLGLTFFNGFPTNAGALTGLTRRMLGPEPDSRPSMNDALYIIKAMQDSMADAELATPVRRNYILDRLSNEKRAELRTRFIRGEELEFVEDNFGS